jgi:hypothetical protein
LCIIQDSEIDKMHFVPRMNFIYGCAVLTIINATGDSALSGLPGVRPGTRFQEEVPFAMEEYYDRDGSGATDTDGSNRMWLMQTHEPVRTQNQILGDSRWFTRGWTFQEAILSQRWLIFTPEQVYWECRQATWREDACWELPPNAEGAQKTIIHEPAFYDSAFQDLWSLSSAENFSRTYQCLVRLGVGQPPPRQCFCREVRRHQPSHEGRPGRGSLPAQQGPRQEDGQLTSRIS